ncbi:MATE family efflux transporter [Ruminococcus gauvreauii]|uniref:Probable multidrug resistance protein NorM n=1 Tax=Ruminococcus gauvreauii TaxID=438033 RepID=A0ABY5VKQ7_9FIRM|nr:MATE family efflux transporter [Ruminococcus gauvreauii]UWP60748.1 MATE family efflux transporter [Ruminococcus gauvreauii]
MEQKISQSKMGTLPVGKLMLNMGIPMILSMVLQAVYNIVDSYFVSNMADTAAASGIGEAAVTALTLAFPVQMLIVAIGIGTGVGTNALLARTLGQGNREKAGTIAGNAITLASIIYAIFLIFGIFGTEAFISTQTEDPLVKEMADQYLGICCKISFGIVFFSVFEKVLQATGKSLFSTIAQIAGAVTNIILDPIMIYGLLGCPAFGISGAAYATVIGQIVSLILAALFHFKLNREIPFHLKHLKLRGRIVGEIYAIGIPAIIAQGVMSVMNYGINIIFGRIGSSYVTAYGIFYKIQQFVLFAAFGLRDAITPVISFNYGLKDPKRIKDGMRFGLLYTFVIMIVCLAALEVFAAPLTGFFSLSDQTKDLCITAMRVVSVSFIFAGANIAFQGIFQALGGGIESLVLSLLRQLIFVLPVAWALAVWAPDIVWITFIIAEALTAGIACIFMKKIYVRKIKTSGV